MLDSRMEQAGECEQAAAWAQVRTCVVHGQRSWGARQTGRIRFEEDGHPRTLRIAYDERGAPYAVDERGGECETTLLSLADEADACACAWADVCACPSLAGVGVDLVDVGYFGERSGVERLARAIFSERERELAHCLDPEDLAYARAVLFGAKEAAFKATSRPLRDWYRRHDEPLVYEVRDFCMTQVGVERGEARHGAAQEALERMGIGRIEVRHERLGNLALVAACAVKRG